MVRNYIRKLATRISKPPAKNIDFFYREAIDILQSGIDPYFRTERTLEQRKRLKDFLERHPEKTEDIPVKLLKKIDQTPLNELTIADLEEIADEINNLRKQGRLKYQLKKNQEDRQFQKDRDELVNAILAGETPKEVEGIGRVGRREGFGKKVGRGIQAWTLRPARIFDMLDGGKNFKGKIHNYFLNKVNDFVDEEYIQTDKRREFLKKKAEELGLNIKELSKTIKIGEMKYSYDEVIDLYAGMKNKMKKLAIIWGEDLSEENTQKFIDKLPDELKAWGDTIIDEYNRNHTRLRNAHIKHKNEDMGHEDYYTPIRRYDIDFQEYSAELADSILHREGLRKAYASRGFTIARKDIPKEFQKPLKLGITSIWQDQVQKQEHYIQGADTIKKLQRMSHDPVFASAVEQKYGREIVKSIQEYVNRVANPNIYKAFNTIENISRTARKHVAISYLAYNLVTMGKQLPSVMFYLPYSGPAHLLGSALKFTMHPFKTVRMVNEFAPQIKHRTFERFSEELKQSSRSTYEKIIDKVGKTGMQGIYFMDKVAVSIGWQAVYDKAVAEGKSIQEASQEATNATMRTQPAAHPKDIARLYATNEGLNWLLQFSNQLNQIWNMFTYDLPVQFTRGQISTAFLTMSGLAVSAGMIWMLSHRRIPRDKEDLRDVFLDQFLNSIPIIGRAIASARRGWYSFDIPPLRGAGALGKAIRDIEAGDIKSSTLIKLIEAISVALGLPYIGPKRGIEAIKEGDIKELIGGEPWETGRKKESPVRPKIGSSGGSKGKSSPVTPKI
jgi:hypothetical protein